jgi:catechol 2,3-dioxygenase-like lactoylglutathione lyase family enzyme
MAIEVLEIHHTGVRIDTGAQLLQATEGFYKDVLGLSRDAGRPTIPGIPGAWINVGEVGQIHLIGGEQPSPVAKGPGEDPTRPHIAFAVKSIVETRKELDRMGVKSWVIEGLVSPDSTQLFMNDPCGNMVELHQIDKCRCRASNRKGA